MEKHKLGVRTIRQLVVSGEIGTTPTKRGNKPKISREFLKLVALHVNIEQVGVHGRRSSSNMALLSMSQKCFKI